MNTIKFQKGAVQMVAHRGLSGIETENTNAAFVAAGNRSYYGIETDIHRTADGRFVVNHDSTLKRVAGEHLVVEECTLAALQNVVLLDKDGTKDRADLRPCSLENYISICKKYEKHCVLELKSEFTEEETVRFLQIIEDLGYLEQVTFISFCYENLLKIRQLRPNQSVQFLFKTVTEERIERLAKDQIDVDIYYESLTEENIAAFHRAGLKVNCWTVDRAEVGERLAAWGVDYITSNILE
ncbi:MAG: hypothetical protein IJY42_03345 [Clostridia bacterium]|nr:hypothetical protein [Clostridia bacterium]